MPPIYVEYLQQATYQQLGARCFVVLSGIMEL
jgi:hypothetical protein